MDTALEKKLQELDGQMESFRRELEKLDRGAIAQNVGDIDKIRSRWQRWISMLAEQRDRLIGKPN